MSHDYFLQNQQLLDIFPWWKGRQFLCNSARPLTINRQCDWKSLTQICSHTQIIDVFEDFIDGLLSNWQKNPQIRDLFCFFNHSTTISLEVREPKNNVDKVLTFSVT